MSTNRVKIAIAMISAAVEKLSDAERAEVLHAIGTAKTTDEDPRAEIARALARANYSVSGAAALLGVSRRMLQLRMKEHGFPPGKRGRPRKLPAK